MKNITQYKMYLKSLSSLLLLFSAHLLFGNAAAQLSAEKELMPYGWIEEQIDWTDAAHIWNQEKAIRLAEKGRLTSIFATDIWGPFGTHLPASPALASDCDNVIDPGSIGYSQQFCESPADTDEITSITAASGGTGDLEYIWIKKIGNGPWEMIPGSTGSSYHPGTVSTSTFFRRCARRSGCEEYIETEIIHITFLTPTVLETKKECGEESNTYTVTLSVSNANVVTANGERIFQPFTYTAPLGTDILIEASGECGTITRTITDEGIDNCETNCPTPSIDINTNITPSCNIDSLSYSLQFSVSDADQVFVNEVLQPGTGPDFSITLPNGQAANILAKKECGDQSVEESRQVEAPNCTSDCPKPTITIDTNGNPSCDPDSLTYTLRFTVEGADEVYLNESLLEGTGPDFSLTLPAGQRACIVAINDCDGEKVRYNREVEAPICTPCPLPLISINTNDNPACNNDSLTYTLQFSVEGAEQVFVNDELQAGTGPDFTIILPLDQNASIQAVKTCEGRSVRASRQVVAPEDCPTDCPKPKISIDTSNTPSCSDDNLSYSLQFTVTNAEEVFVNDELQAGTGPDFTISLPVGQDASILARRQCDGQSVEETLVVESPNCPDTCPTPSITIDTDGNPACDPDSLTYTLTFTVSDADEVFVNDELQAGVGPVFSITLPAGETARILAKNQCDDGEFKQASRQVEAPICTTECPKPNIIIETNGNPVCNADSLTYTLNFTVTGADEVYMNEVLLEGTGPDFTVTLPNGIRACMVAIKDCDGQDVRANREVDAPDCPNSCPVPTVNVTVGDENPVCNEDGETYTITFSVDNEPDSVFVNGELQATSGPDFSITLPLTEVVNIRAVKICGDLTAEDNETINPPECPSSCPVPTVNVTVGDENPVCNEDGETYTITFSVDNEPDSVFVNGELQASNGPDFSITLPLTEVANIRAVKICGDLTAEDNEIINPPDCPNSCPVPTVNVTVGDDNPACNEDDETYTITFSVDNEPDSVFVNGDLQATSGPDFSITLPLTEVANIRAVKICGDLSAEDNETINPPDCCPAPEISLDIDGQPTCSDDGLSYTFSFSVDPVADSVFINGVLSTEAGPSYSVTLPIAETAEIRAVAVCGELTAEDNLTVTPPDCCPAPEISLDIDGQPTCSEDGLSYTFSFSVDPVADSVFINGVLSTEAGPSYDVTLPIAETAEIRAVAICGELTAEDNLTVTPPDCCPAPEISLDIDGQPTCSDDGLSYTFSFSVDPVADSVFINGVLSTEAGPSYSVTLPIAETAQIRAVAICGELTAEDNLTVTPPDCCPAPEISLDIDGQPTCSEDGLSYTFSFSVDPVADSVFINGVLSTEAGPSYSVTLPIAETAEIRAVAICGELTAEDNLTVTPPDCCPAPEISLDIDGQPTCSDDGLSYTFSFSVDPLADSVFINGVLSTEAGPSYSVTLPIAETAEIRAVAICGELTAEDNLTVTPPDCCPAPEISLDIDGQPTCSDDGLSYTFSFSVDPVADSVFINGVLSTEAGPSYDVTLPIAETAEIRAVAICGELTAEDNLTVTPPDCCPAPEISLDIDGQPTCSDDGLSYTFSFSVDPVADSVFINGVLSTDAGPSYDVTLPIAETAEIRAVAICGELTAEDNLTVTPPDCCPAPEISLDIDGQPTCSDDGLSYTFSFSVDPVADSVFINGVLSTEAGPSYDVTLPIAETAQIRAVAICGELTAEDNLTVTPPTCPNCTLEVDVTTVASSVCPERELCTILTAVVFEGQPAYQYSWTDEQGTILGTADTLEVCLPGTYFIEVMDQDSCIATDSIAIIEDCPVCDITVEIVPSDASLTDCDQVLTAAVQGGTAPFTYSWTKDGQAFGNTESINVTGMAGNYVLTVTDAENCEAVSTITITPCCPSQATVRESLFLPNAFSPNNDGINDDLRFVIQNTETGNPLADLEATVYIFNRWGEQLKTFNSFKDTWDGTFRGKILAPDVYGYYFIIRCSTSGEIVLEEKGNITILK